MTWEDLLSSHCAAFPSPLCWRLRPCVAGAWSRLLGTFVASAYIFMCIWEDISHHACRWKRKEDSDVNGEGGGRKEGGERSLLLPLLGRWPHAARMYIKQWEQKPL